jgi:hypothetical protein
MKADELCSVLEEVWPKATRGMEAVVAVAPGQFRESFGMGSVNIVETLALADFGTTFGERGSQTWADYLVAVDEASFHAGMAAVFVRQLLELGKERVPVLRPDPRVFVVPPVEIPPWRVGGDELDALRRDAIAKGFALASRCHHLRQEMDMVSGWEGLACWMASFLHLSGALVTLAAEVCAYQWSPRDAV